MKKSLYYGMPFLAFPLTALLCNFLHYVSIVELNFNIWATVFVLISIVIGNLSPTNKMFDYAIPAVSAIAWLSYKFIFGFFSKTDLETRFSIFEAIEWICVDTTQLLCAIIAVTTFLASFRPIRIMRIIKKH